MIITIDGPAASGKSTVGRLLAEKLGAHFLDTGAMYRALTFAAIRAGVDMASEEELLKVLQDKNFDFRDSQEKMLVKIDGQQVSSELRTGEVTSNVHYIADSPGVREKLVELQRIFASRYENVVTEGRDQGTVVFPQADMKFFLTATLQERARRRQAQEGVESKRALGEIRKAIEQRDETDKNRQVGALKKADDAVVIDTTNMTAEQVAEGLCKKVKSQRTKVRSKRNETETPHKAEAPWHSGLIGELWYRLARWGCRLFCIVFFAIRVFGQDNIPPSGGFLLVSNHQSYLDPVFCGVGLTRPVNFLARDSLFSRTGLLGRFFSGLISSVNAIPVRRGAADLSAIKKVLGRLRDGEGVCLYPEATRSGDGRVSLFKGGVALLCRRAKVPVVPAVVDGAYECWPRYKKFFKPGKIFVRYGKPFLSKDLENMHPQQIAEVLTSKIRTMQNELREKQGKEKYRY